MRRFPKGYGAECKWCGTGRRGRDRCPRGKGCTSEYANHKALTEAIARDKK